ncbi:hypothetical protein [Congregibacter sp.]|uniref:hypothetical protein n=1 Tax=Congregibacter sp. TaxID=2744308 RepID=UPI003F6AB8CC
MSKAHERGGEQAALAVSSAPLSSVHQGGRFFAMNPRQIIKILVYSLLLVNWINYIINDITVASHTVHAGWQWHDWTSAFATTLDEAAWFLLLFLLELETYLLSDDAFTKTRVRVMQGLRLLCIVFIGHTIVAFGNILMELGRSVEHAATDVCAFAGQGLSYARNLEYWEITADSCASIASAGTLYQFDQGQLITDAAGLRVEWELAWADFLEVVLWVCILFFIEVMVRLQEKGVTDGTALKVARISKAVLYGFLWLIAAYWASGGHWMFAWDESLWILGFIAIGMNLSEWRDEIQQVSSY